MTASEVPALFPNGQPWRQQGRNELWCDYPNLACSVYHWSQGYTVRVGYRTWLSKSLDEALEWARREILATGYYIRNVARE